MKSLLLLIKALSIIVICQMAVFSKPGKVLHLYGFGERPHMNAAPFVVELMNELSKEHGFALTHAKSSDAIANIQDYDVVLFNSTAFKSFNKASEQEKIIEWMTDGGKAIGFNHTCDIRGTWDWWGEEMCGAGYEDDFFRVLTLEADTEIEKIPALKTAWDANNLGEQIEFPRTEVKIFSPNPRGKEGVTILLTVDQGHNTDIGDHPYCWLKKVGKGEFINTALGHQKSDFENGWMKKATWAWMEYLTVNSDPVGVGERYDAPFVRFEMGKNQVHIKDSGRHSVQVFDLQGRLCGHWSGTGGRVYPLHGLKSGIYYLKVKSAHLDYTHPVIAVISGTRYERPLN